MYPKTQFRMEAAGSVDCARKITELGRSCDILASADYLVIDELLIPEYASDNRLFAVNSMVIAYTGNHAVQSRSTATTGPLFCFRPMYATDAPTPRRPLRLPDPADPAAGRTLLHGKAGTMPFKVSDFTEKDTRFIRPKEVDLLALLGNHAIDYIFIYKSVALQHNLRYLELPPQINLGDRSLAEQYARATLTVRGSSPGDSLKVTGTPITYSFTIPHNAENPQLAKEFARFLTDSLGGQKILRAMGQ